MYFSIYTYEPDAEGREVLFSHDKYKFKADSWFHAEMLAKEMNLPYRYEVIEDCPEESEDVSDDFILDAIIERNKNEHLIKRI